MITQLIKNAKTSYYKIQNKVRNNSKLKGKLKGDLTAKYKRQQHLHKILINDGYG